jgi:hypothetical protein
MNDTLLISNEFLCKIDSLFFDENNIEGVSINLEYELTKLLKSNLDSKYKNIIVLLNDLMFDNVSKTSNLFDASKHNINDLFEKDSELFFKNFTNFFERFPKNTKFILIDNNPESPVKPIPQFVSDWLKSYSNTYFISCRFNNINHDRSLTGITYLPLIYSFYEQKFNNFPKLDYGRPCNTNQTFITFLGHSEKTDKIKRRLNFLEGILKDGLEQVKYETDSNKKLGLKYFEQPARFGHEWNLLESLSVKIQLIFETIDPLVEYHNEYFFSEKTMKLFLLPHPYFLLSHGSALLHLEKFGFEFPDKCFSYSEYENTINYILNNSDEWVDKNIHIFYKNQNIFYEIVNSTELHHHLFIKNIIQPN